MRKSDKGLFASIPLAAEPIFEIGNFTITNSLFNAYIGVAFFILVAFLVRKKITQIPRGFYNVVEALVEFALKEIEKVTGDKKRARQFLPLVATIFFFILFSNWLGQIPGTGTIGVWGYLHGHFELIPLLRPATSDLNMTLAIAIVAIATTHFAGLTQLGVANHISKFFNIRGIVRSLKKGPMDIVVAVVEFFIGLIEVIGEFAKTLSLSLRLFGNIFAGEVLMHVMLSLVSYVLPIPFIFLELLVGIIQATVFAMLTLAFLVVATMDHGHEGDHEEHRAEPAHA